MSTVLPGRTVRIGGASGAWGDSPRAIGQLLVAGVDYLMMDYLAEVTMSLLARAQQRNPEAGYPADALAYLAPHLSTLESTGTKVASNGGGVNPHALKKMLEQEIADQGLSLSVGIVSGDDVREFLDGSSQDSPYLTANAYLGALPIKKAFDEGADIVLTGRCADSALALGILMHEFAWNAEDFDLLASGSLVGHLLECGPQATGGNFTDWEEVPDWHNIGYPIAECAEDGQFIVTKAPGTGGLIDTRCLTEQLFYEIGNPARYVLPDVVADFSNTRLTQVDGNSVLVSGVAGSPPTSQYKVSATRQTQYRTAFSIVIGGPNSVAKAEKTAAELLLRADTICSESSAGPLTDHHIELLGAESIYGVPDRSRGNREIFLRVVMTHPSRELLNAIAQETGSIGLGFAPGVMGVYGGRPKAAPQIVLETRFIDKAALPAPSVQVGQSEPVAVDIFVGSEAPASESPEPSSASPILTSSSLTTRGCVVPLGAIAYARSGDKGDTSNIAVIARAPEFYQVILNNVDDELIRRTFLPLEFGDIEAFPTPGLLAVNFLIQSALGGGGIASLRIDPQGKAYGQRLLEARVTVPEDVLHRIDPDLTRRYSLLPESPQGSS